MTPTTVDPAMQELYKLLLQSDKFINWRPSADTDGVGALRTKQMDEKHYTPDDLAELWGVSTETIRSIFRDEQGVLKIGSTGAKYKRGYITLRIPKSVAERVHTRLSA